MPALDFRDIPEAHLPGGDQDVFEIFARDFLRHSGFEVVEGPDRGIDGGRDLIAIEERTGVGGTTQVRWLVSCKHKAHSGAAVGLPDEPDILERLKAHGCAGFIGFYSTLPSSSLAGRLSKLGAECLIFDRGRIESDLLESVEGLKLAERYFPESFAEWRRENPRPALIFAPGEALTCVTCGRDLLSPPSGIIVIWRKMKRGELGPTEFTRVYWVCKGSCDAAAKHLYDTPDTVDVWEDIPDICIPTVYLKWAIGIINELVAGDRYEAEALEQLKHFMVLVFPHVARELTAREQERLRWLGMIPTALGGFGE